MWRALPYPKEQNHVECRNSGFTGHGNSDIYPGSCRGYPGNLHLPDIHGSGVVVGVLEFLEFSRNVMVILLALTAVWIWAGDYV
jgi:hypothetical protein